MDVLRSVVVAVVMAFAVLVVIFLPYPALSPRWFFTAVGVVFVACGLAGFVLPTPRKRGGNDD